MAADELIDLKAELLAALVRDNHIEDPDYRKLPVLDGSEPGVVVHNDETPWGLAEWHVELNPSFVAADVAEVRTLAEVLLKAAQRAEILNAPAAIGIQTDELMASKAAGPHLVRVLRGYPGMHKYSFSKNAHLDEVAPGYQWGDDDGEFLFEYVGRFRMGASINLDGVDRTVFFAEATT